MLFCFVFVVFALFSLLFSCAMLYLGRCTLGRVPSDPVSGPCFCLLFVLCFISRCCFVDLSFLSLFGFHRRLSTSSFQWLSFIFGGALIIPCFLFQPFLCVFPPFHLYRPWSQGRFRSIFSPFLLPSLYDAAVVNCCSSFHPSASAVIVDIIQSLHNKLNNPSCVCVCIFLWVSLQERRRCTRKYQRDSILDLDPACCCVNLARRLF